MSVKDDITSALVGLVAILFSRAAKKVGAHDPSLAVVTWDQLQHEIIALQFEQMDAKADQIDMLIAIGKLEKLFIEQKYAAERAAGNAPEVTIIKGED